MKNLLMVGYGDIATRIFPLILRRYHVYALTRCRRDCLKIKKDGAILLLGDLDQRFSLIHLPIVADIVLHFVPPTKQGKQDQRTRHLIYALSRKRILPQQLIYISTSGVYGDCQGKLIDESQLSHPQTDRALRRYDAENCLLRWGRYSGVQVCILRVPGIYAANRLPIERLEQEIPALRQEEDVYTNHIHADDLAHIVVAAIKYGKSGQIYHASDDSEIKMADYFDKVADYLHLPRPVRITREEAKEKIPSHLLSFMSESRRLDNTRMKKELGVRLIYPTVTEGLENIMKKVKGEE